MKLFFCCCLLTLVDCWWCHAMLRNGEDDGNWISSRNGWREKKSWIFHSHCALLFDIINNNSVPVEPLPLWMSCSAQIKSSQFSEKVSEGSDNFRFLSALTHRVCALKPKSTQSTLSLLFHRRAVRHTHSSTLERSAIRHAGRCDLLGKICARYGH